ncbi:MAG: hypothetical protein B7Y36_18850 [Novosphingobium sp. 28-62-57]|uniref:hypothetical protein n=1 Tax=Novosphingobium sp. 28-62-57 TaxID=1970409 RepID=UPI000BD1DE79|nr:hypothetical protein [Novosphingobium sp. 28-62-57]OYW50742.1 MAG: hypothetical protein B7Z34_02645 [Novosphingobium sp. 12-62-10]OYZ07777.1 MAG: hypothetical protein B7Y36_18850 [Novosphingobium sp. 28-62-57]
MPVQHVAVLWPDEANYARLVAISDDWMPPSLADYRGALLRRAELRGWTEADFLKVDFDPDVLASWCRENFGTVNADSRSAYASFIGKLQFERTEENRTSRRSDH